MPVKKITVIIFIALTLSPVSLLAIKANFQFTRVCVGSETRLISTSTPSDSIFNVLWDLDGDGVFNDDIGDTVTVFFSSSGSFNVGVKVIALNGDQDAIYKQVPVASLQVAFSADYSCRNLPVHFFDESIIVADTAFQYIWSFGDGSQGSFLQDPIHTYVVAGEYTASLVVISTSGCIDSASLLMYIGNPPAVDIIFTGDMTFMEGDSLIATIAGVYDSVFWSTGEETNSIVIHESGDYYVRGYLDGCFGEKSFTVTVVPDPTVRIMTVITPNGDGFNDRWEVINIAEIEPCSVEIYNRWGKKVFSASPYNNDWDGTDNGKPLSNDTYYYFLSCKDGTLQTGTINIVR
ncbi:gliding motility-associated C-terminal domain-containing protein [Bacteroidota bacterium]